MTRNQKRVTNFLVKPMDLYSFAVFTVECLTLINEQYT